MKIHFEFKIQPLKFWVKFNVLTQVARETAKFDVKISDAHQHDALQQSWNIAPYISTEVCLNADNSIRQHKQALLHEYQFRIQRTEGGVRLDYRRLNAHTLQ
jgi:hypothetical protein